MNHLAQPWKGIPPTGQGVTRFYVLVVRVDCGETGCLCHLHHFRHLSADTYVVLIPTTAPGVGVNVCGSWGNSGGVTQFLRIAVDVIEEGRL